MAGEAEELVSRLITLLAGGGGPGSGGLALIGGIGERAESLSGGVAVGGADVLEPLRALVGNGSRTPALESIFPLAGLVSAFRAEEQQATAFERFELPARLDSTLGYDAAAGSLGAVEYGDRQTVRPVAEPRVAGPQVTINVNAMDGRSILDRSEEIADAVRSALLNSHSLSEVFWED
ncbi:MAG: hypothetical protein SFV51_08895 [Bryobacteraceae bacterium]|nr:hypothetical protein [Bryobacteraceae bacterium]